MHVLITGATDGIGRETAKELLRRGHDVHLHGRNAERLQDIARVLSTETGRNVAATWCADLSDLGAVRAMAERIESSGTPLSALVNNAGTFETTRVALPDGRERTLAINVDGPFLLTRLLLPLLARASDARVVHVSSIAHTRGKLDVGDLDARNGFSGYGAYAASKLANLMLSNALAKRLATTSWGKHITTNALHPGVVTTKLLKVGFGGQGPDSHADGAATSVYLVDSDEVRGVTGKYFVRSKEARAGNVADDAVLEDALWAACCARVGVDSALA